MEPLQQFDQFEAAALATLTGAKDAAAVEAALTPIVTAPAVPPPVIGAVTLTAVMSP